MQKGRAYYLPCKIQQDRPALQQKSISRACWVSLADSEATAELAAASGPRPSKRAIAEDTNIHRSFVIIYHLVFPWSFL